MAGVFFEQFGMGKPDYSLGVGSGSHGKQTAQILSAYEEILLSFPPAAVIVIGDVNSTVACSLAATKLHIPTIHLEAGLRSNDRTMPEELNRIVTDHLCDMLWTPSPDGDENLQREGISPEKIVRVGNIMIDTLVNMEPLFTKRNMKSELGLTTPHVLLTLHRPSNVDTKETLEKLLSQLIHIGETHSLVWPMHPRTRSRIKEFELDFEDYTVKGRDSKGNIVSKYVISKVSYKGKSKISTASIDDINKIEVQEEKEISDDEPQGKLF